MFDIASMARVANGLLGLGTLNTKTLSVAFMEFLESGDSNAMKGALLGHGFQDVSPLWGDRPQVPTFKESPQTIARWPEFQQAMIDVEADWYYLSGHHGRQFASDGEELGAKEHYNTQEKVGFFNEVYHHGRWDQASANDPYRGQHSQEVYMSTSTDWVYDMGPEDNPLYDHVHEDCRGVYLVGCNALAYRHCRIMLSQYFPNAVIMGPFTKENSSIYKHLKLIGEYGRDFLVNPRDYDPEELIRFLNPVLRSPDAIAILRDGSFYFPAATRVCELGVDEEVTAENNH